MIFETNYIPPKWVSQIAAHVVLFASGYVGVMAMLPAGTSYVDWRAIAAGLALAGVQSSPFGLDVGGTQEKPPVTK